MSDFAKYFAYGAHAGQKYGPHPYTYHLEQVIEVADLNVRKDAPRFFVEAAWLHDVLEDTPVTKTTLVELFGQDVADLVDAVTDPPTPGLTRKERKKLTYAKMVEYRDSCYASHGLRSPLVTLLKLCDRIANVEYSLKTGNLDKLGMYRNEYPAFRTALYLEGQSETLWARLEKALG